jgi:hypothetical protein
VEKYIRSTLHRSVGRSDEEKLPVDLPAYIPGHIPVILFISIPDVRGCVALKALPGSEIPYYRIKEFVDWLTLHFKVMAANADGYQSLEMTQYFTLKGLRSRVVSVDRTPCVGYATTRSAIDDERIVVPDHPLLEKEWMELEETETGKIDHMYDESGNPAGSKDVSDCIAGCIQEIVASSESMEIVNNSKETALRDLQATLGGSDYDDDDDLLAF